MRGVRNTEDGIRVLDLPAPEPTGDQVRVRVAAAGICGLVVGMENFSDQAVRSANASTALELYDAGQVEDITW
jgi:NADPH:quinone reductase-like Zn-dependent oxidoreductase